jgi:hypothetical protein
MAPGDYEVDAKFKCSSDVVPLLPMMLGTLGLLAWTRRIGSSE